MNNFKPFSHEMFWLRSAPACKDDEGFEKKIAGV